MDAQQFAAQFERLRSDFILYATRLVGADQAEDAVQEAMLTAIRILPVYQDHYGLRGLCGWVYEILWRKCSEIRRREEKSRQAWPLFDQDEDSDVSFPDAYLSTVDVAELATQRAMLRVMIASADLSDAQRACIEGRLNSVSDAETAERLGITEGAVRAHVSVAIGKIRETCEVTG